MTTIETIYRGPEPRAHASKASAGRARFSLASALTRLEAILERRRSRKALLEMTDDQLKDIGLSRSEAHGEAYRPFWD
jgi:uncharacterized protein YjiS (DUF1127 family)